MPAAHFRSISSVSFNLEGNFMKTFGLIGRFFIRGSVLVDYPPWSHELLPPHGPNFRKIRGKTFSSFLPKILHFPIYGFWVLKNHVFEGFAIRCDFLAMFVSAGFAGQKILLPPHGPKIRPKNSSTPHGPTYPFSSSNNKFSYKGVEVSKT